MSDPRERASLVAELESAAGTPCVSGGFERDGLQARWSVDGLILTHDGHAERIDETRRVSVQLARWRRSRRASRWQRLLGRGRGPHQELHAELRGEDGLRLALSAEVADGARLGGLPWMHRSADVELSEDELVALLEAACAHGAQIARWEPEAARVAPPLERERSLSLLQRTTVLFSHFLVTFAALWLAIAGPISLVFVGAPAHEPVLQLPMLFPLVGVIVAYFGLVQGVRAARQIERGRFTVGVLCANQRTNTSYNKQTVHCLRYRYTTPEGREHFGDFRTHERRLKDRAVGERQQLLYDPDDTAHVLPVEALPRGLEFDDEGQLRGSGRLVSLLVGGLLFVELVVVLFVFLAFVVSVF